MSTPFSADVRMCGPRKPWSASTPTPQTPLLLRGVERAEAAAARDLEHDDRAGRDLVERDLLALRLVREVLRVPVQRLDPRDRGLRTRLVAGDVTVDRRLLLAADARDRRSAARLRGEAGRVAREVARLLLLEEQAFDVLQAAFVGVRDVDDREVRLRERFATAFIASISVKPTPITRS